MATRKPMIGWTRTFTVYKVTDDGVTVWFGHVWRGYVWIVSEFKSEVHCISEEEYFQRKLAGELYNAQ